MMASNPMQRKSKNSFLLGMLAALVVTGAIIIILLGVLKQKNDELNAEKNGKVLVYTLAQDVKAAQILTKDMFEEKIVHKDTIPNSATSTQEVIDAWFLQTKEGEAVSTDKYGLYLDRTSGDKAPDSIIEVMKNTGEEFKDSKGNKIATGENYIDLGGTIEKVNSTNGVQTDEYGMFLVDTQGNDKIVRVYQEELTEEFYVFKLDTTSINTSGNQVRVKEYINIKNVPVIARVDMNANTVITPELVVQSSEIVTDDTRQEQYNMITLPIDLMSNDYVDIRFKTPGGQNFIVVSKVKVDIPMTEDGTYIADTIRVDLREDEILAMSSAIVEAYGLDGELYLTKYVDPAMQEAAFPTYTPNAAVTAQIQSNPNIVETAKQELATRYSEAAKKARNDYLQQIINNANAEGEYDSNIRESMTENMGSSLTTRQKYLESLTDTEEEE